MCIPFGKGFIRFIRTQRLTHFPHDSTHREVVMSICCGSVTAEPEQAGSLVGAGSGVNCQPIGRHWVMGYGDHSDHEIVSIRYLIDWVYPLCKWFSILTLNYRYMKICIYTMVVSAPHILVSWDPATSEKLFTLELLGDYHLHCTILDA